MTWAVCDMIENETHLDEVLRHQLIDVLHWAKCEMLYREMTGFTADFT